MAILGRMEFSLVEVYMSAPTPLQFFVETPLYEVVTFTEDQDAEATAIVYAEGPLDIYCPQCNQHSIFKRNITGVVNDMAWRRAASRVICGFHCSRDFSHSILFWLEISGTVGTIQKIGQMPSLATLCMYDLQKYRSVLKPDIFREFTKAIGLAAHGVGVGSFVYLRRIFENLVEQAHVLAKFEAGWDESLYESSRMAEKIHLLRNFLPAFLIDNRTIYSILSKGIHELTEDECLAAFPAVKIAIEIILDAQLQADADKRKIVEATRALQAIASSNGGKR